MLDFEEWKINELTREFKQRYEALLDTGHHEVLAWYDQQPINLIKHTLDEVSLYVFENSDDYDACHCMIEKGLSDLGAYINFHSRLMHMIDTFEVSSSDLHWRLKSPSWSKRKETA